MLLDLFFESISTARKRRVHFHEFMKDFHTRMHETTRVQRDGEDPVASVAEQIISESWVLCFDEFQVTDIVDAVVLKRLFFHLFSRGVILVSTSNRSPDDLYLHGLQRALFLPFIELLKTKCDVYCMNSNKDYRLQEKLQVQCYYCPNNVENNLKIDKLYKRLTGKPITESQVVTLTVYGRAMKVYRAMNSICLFTFFELIAQPHSAADYLELCKNFDVIFLKDIPKLRYYQRIEARRFINLIDTIYDARRMLICSCEVAPQYIFSDLITAGLKNDPSEQDRLLIDDLGLCQGTATSTVFTGEDEIFAAERCVSRLVELHSQDYWK
ncbi:AFG1-like ATPase, partial [Zophobas morio]|uniref:AFG1-like ATPase n=1 Tax=Zophobas morio TaxID=2755281 RepID=UPI0030838583